MTREKRQQLATRAYPDPMTLTTWKRRAGWLLFVAFALGVLHLYLQALIVLLIAVPDMVRYVRRELALGALIAAAHHREHQRSPMPTIDLRDAYRQH